MHRISKFIFILSAVIYTTSCSEIITADFSDKTTRITVRSEVELTKAGYEGTTSLPSEFIIDINQGSDSKYNYSLVKMTKESTGNTYEAPEDINLLWANSNHDDVSVKAITVPFGKTTADDVNPMAVSVSLDQTTEENLCKSDLLYAETGNGIVIEDDEIRISFSHILTKLCVDYKLSSRLKKTTASVSSITLNNVCVTGGYSYANMNYDNSVEKKNDNISMYLDNVKNRAEAIFYPYNPAKSPELIIRVNIGNEYKDVKCPVSLKNEEGFTGGKSYKMAIKISGTSLNNLSVAVTDESLSAYGKKILWIGTSITKGKDENNYPRIVAEALGCTIFNNAQSASRVSMNPTPDWTTYSELDSLCLKYYSLSASYDEYDALLKDVIENLGANNQLGEGNVNAWMGLFKEHSYENVLLPYIDGTIESCETVIIDHGFNDSENIISESFGYGSLSEGLDWLERLACGEEKYEDKFHLGKKSYFNAVSFIIEKCREVNPDIKIIIGNYFATRPFSYTWDFKEYGGAACCDLMLSANEAIAEIYGLDIVNVYKYTGLDDDKYFTEFKKFCPADYVHPHNDTSGESIQKIADIYIKELTRIFSEE